MAVQLQRLIQKVSHMDVTLIAGKDGMNRLVSWVHMVETMEASDFLQGGEIAFTTGLGLSNSISMLTLTEYIYDKGAAGIIVNIGPFIENIPQDVIDFCNEHSFPLFVIPWKIHLAEVMRIFCFTITKDDQRILQTSSAFKNAIFFPKILYDEKNQSDLVTVLRSYLKHNGSVKETADELYLHRNTINYKLSRVESLLDIDLSSLDSRLQLSIGFMLLDML